MGDDEFIYKFDCSNRPDISVLYKVFGSQTQAISDSPLKSELGMGVPVFVMLPLDSVTSEHTSMDENLNALKNAGVEGVMVDVWWGVVESAYEEYNWSAYEKLFDLVRKRGLKVQAVMSFHKCGGNVGDPVSIPLPKWVLEEMESNQDLAYTDQLKNRNDEYISLGCDDFVVLKNRTPVQCYADYMKSFEKNFNHLMGKTIVEIQVGMGPAGELRYPSYPLSRWEFPGIGEFQCYDKYMLAKLKATAEEWDYPPTNAGDYNKHPEKTDFFCSEGDWDSPNGKSFLQWYSDMLLDHGERILKEAKSIFHNTPVRLSGKVAGIHWHYLTRSHAPELTAGYYNTGDRDGTRSHAPELTVGSYNTSERDGYLPIAQMFGRHGVVFNFTCIEMKDEEQPKDAKCSPETLVYQVILATTRKARIPLAGENALPRFDEAAYTQILKNSSQMCAFTYLRMCEELFQPENWRRFESFVRRMSAQNPVT